MERGIAHKGTDVEIVGFGSTLKTTLTGIGELRPITIPPEIINNVFDPPRNVPQGA